MDIDDMSYEGEEIKLGGKVRHIKYTIKGLKILAKKYGTVIKAFNKLENMNQEFDVETMDHLTLLLHAGLVHEDERITVEATENLLTFEILPVVFTKILKSFGGSMPQPTDDGGSNDNPGESLQTSTSLNTPPE